MADDVVGFTDAPNKRESQKLTRLGSELYELDVKIDDLEEQLSSSRERRRELTEKLLPDYMTSIGQDRLGLAEHDVDVVLEDYYHANISADWEPERRVAGFDWLEKNDGGDLVKVLVTVAFPRGDLMRARALEQKIVEWGEESNSPIPTPEVTMSVAWNTLTAWVRDRISKGAALPLETLGATVGRVAKLKKRKATKRSV